MRPKGPGYKKAWAVQSENLSRMSVDVSPARYLGRKRKSAKHAHPAEKKKKKKKKKEEEEPASPCRTPEDCDPVVREVVEGTRTAVEDMMKELNDMVEQSTPTPPPFTLTTLYDKAEDSERKGHASVDYMVCPCHDVHLEAHQSQKGWPYVKCPVQVFCGQDQAFEYMKAVYSQPHPEVLDMWSGLQCFCREPAMLQQSHSTQNPDRLYVTCSKKKCHFFRWADQPLGPKYWSWFHDHPPKKPTHSPNHRCPPVMLKGIPSGAMTSQALHLESEGKRTWNKNVP